jgi:HEAT repeat protein
MRAGTRHLLLCAACALAALTGCASPTDHALDLGEARAEAEFPDRVRLLSAMALDRSAKPAARFAAIRSLAHIGGAEAVGPLAAVARRPDSSPYRRWGVWALGETDAPEAVPVLAELASSARDEAVLQQALQGLARLSGVVAGSAESRHDALAAVNAVECRFGEAEQICALAALLREDLANLDDFAAILTESAERGDTADACNALDWTGDLLLARPDAEPAARRHALEVVTSLLDGENAPLRLRALWNLGRVADPAAAPQLVEAARSHPDRATRLLAVWALRRADRSLFEQTFDAMPPELLSVTPGNWREARDRAAQLGEADLEIQRLIADLLREGAR